MPITARILHYPETNGCKMNNFFTKYDVYVNTYCLKSTFFKDISGELDHMRLKSKHVSHVAILLTCVSANSLLTVY